MPRPNSERWLRLGPAGRGLILLLAWLLQGVLGAAPAPKEATGEPAPTRGARAQRFHPGRLLIRPKGGKESPALAKFHGARGARVAKSFTRARNVHVLELPPGADVLQWAEKYRKSGLVDFAEPDFKVHAAVAPNDSAFVNGSLWGLRNTGQSGGRSGADIHAVAGWDLLRSASNIVVAVVDSGIRLTHEDLAPNLWVNPGEIPGNGIDDDGDGFVDDVHGMNILNRSGNPGDDYGHGTHVAGIIGAAGNNGKGVVGVAWQVQLMALKFLDKFGDGDTSDAMECIDYARRHGAHIVNASWTGSDVSEALETSIRDARDAGIIVVCAAGNESSDDDTVISYPSSYRFDNIVSVAATTRSDQFDASYSNFGLTTVHIGAPGTSIFSTSSDGDRDYTYKTGTSMATAYVSGAMALLKARHPGDTHTQLIGRLLAAADPLPSLQGKCASGGRLNIEKALGPAVEADFSVSPNYGAEPLDATFANTSFGAFTEAVWNFGDRSATSSEAAPTHRYLAEGVYFPTLTIRDGAGGLLVKTQRVDVVANYRVVEAPFSWVDSQGMGSLSLGANGVSAAQTMPFPFRFYGAVQAQFFVGRNGIIGFDGNGLAEVNVDLPSASLPNRIICPYWSDLQIGPDARIAMGVDGAEPNRRLVVTWDGVTQNGIEGGLTFQAILEESTDRILFQYLRIDSRVPGGTGSLATIGLENENGRVAAKHSFRGVPELAAAGKAVAFVPKAKPELVTLPGHAVTFSSLSQTNIGIKNGGNAPLTWYVQNAADWLSLSATNGLLAAGATANVTLSPTPEAALLDYGTYSTELLCLNLDNGVGDVGQPVRMVVEPLRLQVAPAPDGANFFLRFFNRRAETILVESSRDLVVWETVFTSERTVDTVEIRITPGAGPSALFYRARAGE